MGTTTKSIGVQEELGNLSRQKIAALVRAKRISGQHDKIWKQEITALAEIIEQEYILLEQQWLITSISQEIARLYRDQDIVVWQHIDRYIPQRFQNPKMQHSSMYLQPSGQDLLVQDYIETLRNVRHMAEHPESIPRDFVADAELLADKLQQVTAVRAKAENIALIPDDKASYTDAENDARQQDYEHISIDRPEPHGSLTYDELTLVIKDLTDVRDRIFEFPPEILEKDQEIAQAWSTWRIWMKPALDLKWSKSWLDWFRAERWRDVYGKHAAGVMSFSLTNLCARCSDEKTKDWVRMEPRYATAHSTYECLQCHSIITTECHACKLPMKEMKKPAVGWVCTECGGTSPRTRSLTREQIGDKSSIVMDAAIEILEHIPSHMGFCLWYHDWLDGYLGGRKDRLSDNLSEKA